MHVNNNSKNMEKQKQCFNESTSDSMEDLELEQKLNNIYKVMSLIKSSNYLEHWNDKNLWDDVFRKIVEIPVFLPSKSTFIVSGEYILQIFLKKEINFKPRPNNNYDEEEKYETDYNEVLKQRFFNKNSGGDNSYIGQFRGNLGLDLSNLPRQAEENLWSFFSIYAFCDQFSFDATLGYSRKKNGSKKNSSKPLHGGKSLLRYVIMPYAHPLEPLTLSNYDNNAKRLMLFKTIIYQKLSYRCQEKICEYTLRLKNNLIWIQRLLNSINILINYKLITVLPKTMRVLYKQMGKFYMKNFKNGSTLIVLPNDNILFLVTMRLIQREELYGAKKFIDNLYSSNEKLPYDSIKQFMRKMQNQYFSLTTKNKLDINRGIEVNTWRAFCTKYKTDLPNEFVENDVHWEKIWNIAVKNLLFRYPQISGFNIEKEQNSIPKSPDNQWYKEHGIQIGKYKIEEIIPMMIVADSTFQEYNNFKKKNNVKYKKTQFLFQKMDNIRKFWNDSTLFDEINKKQDNIIKNDYSGKEWKFLVKICQKYIHQVSKRPYNTNNHSLNDMEYLKRCLYLIHNKIIPENIKKRC